MDVLGDVSRLVERIFLKLFGNYGPVLLLYFLIAFSYLHTRLQRPNKKQNSFVVASVSNII